MVQEINEMELEVLMGQMELDTQNSALNILRRELKQDVCLREKEHSEE